MRAPEVSEASRNHLGKPVTVPRWLTSRRLEAVLVGAPLLLVAAAAYVHRWTSDEGYAYFRVVEQLLAGNGPVFNIGERVETVDSPLWVALLAAADLIGPLRLEYAAALLAAASMVGGLALAAAGAWRLTSTAPPGGAIRLPAGLTVIAVLWPVWVWSTSGTEIALCVGWVGACVWLLARWATPSRGESRAPTAGVPLLAVLGLGWVVRPELVVVSAIFVTTVVLHSAKSTRRRVRLTATALAIPVAYQLCRMGYFGMVVSNRSITREDTAPRPGLGWRYLTDLANPYLLFVPLIAVGVAFLLPQAVRSLTAIAPGGGTELPGVVGSVMALAGLADIVVVVVIMGGDDAHARLLLPGLILLLSPVFVVRPERQQLVAVTVVAIWALCCALLLRPESDVRAPGRFTVGYPGPGFTSHDAGVSSRGNPAWLDAPGLYVYAPFLGIGERLDLELADPARSVVATGAIGLLGYTVGLDVDVYDIYGSTDAIWSHRAFDGRLPAGQEKPTSPEWLIARLGHGNLTDISFDAVDLSVPYAPRPRPLEALERRYMASDLLRCDRFQRIDRASTAALDPGRFLSNIWRAMSNTTMRFSGELDMAYRYAACAVDGRSATQTFYRAIVVDAVLPREPDVGRVAVAGVCTAVAVAVPTPGQNAAGDEPATTWDVVDAHRVAAVVELDPGDTSPGLVAVFTLGPISRGWAVVWFAVDGTGQYRVTQQVPWFGTVARSWRPIPESGTVEVAIEADLGSDEWVTVAAGEVVARVPIINPEENGGAHRTAVPEPAEPGAPEPVVRHAAVTATRTCEAVLDAQPVPVGGRPRSLPM